MGWLAKILGYVPAKERGGISLVQGPAWWEVSAPEDAASFLRAIAVLAPPESVLYLEGGSPSEEIRAYLAERAPAKTTKVAVGTIWPRLRVFHMSITPRNLEGLADLADRRAFPELAIHLHVYKGTDMFLQWYDAGGRDPLLLSKQIPVERVREFCNRLGVEYRHIDDER